MATPDHRPIRTAELALAMTLYALQGVSVAYLANTNKAYMVAAGVSERLAGWVETAVLLVLVLKFLLGPISDRFSPFGLGHRRPYIVAGLAMQSAGLAGLATIDPGAALAAYAAAALVAVLGLSLYDTACDGLVVDATPPDDRTRVQGLLQLARFLATMGSTLLFGLWMDRTGVGPGRSGGVLWACATLGLPPLALALMSRDRLSAGGGERGSALEALGTLAGPGAVALLIYGALYGMVGMGVEFNLSRYYGRLGYDPGAIGWLGALRYGGRAGGALLLPAFRGLERRGTLIVGLVALAATVAGQAAVTGPASAAASAVAFGVAIGWSDALFCALAMDASDPRMAASTFAVFMAASNLSFAGNALFFEVVRASGGRYGPAFLVAAAASAALVAMAPALTRRRPPITEAAVDVDA